MKDEGAWYVQALRPLEFDASAIIVPAAHGCRVATDHQSNSMTKSSLPANIQIALKPSSG